MAAHALPTLLHTSADGNVSNYGMVHVVALCQIYLYVTSALRLWPRKFRQAHHYKQKYLGTSRPSRTNDLEADVNQRPCGLMYYATPEIVSLRIVFVRLLLV
jgi:hypothetical protein